MKRFATIGIVTLLVSWAVIVIVQVVAGKSETSNVTDADDLPGFYVSDPSLLNAGPYRIQERFPGATQWRSGAETAYFVQLSDGRYACGYTDSNGKTKPVFTDRVVPHRVFWDEDAWNKWRDVRGIVAQ